MKLNKKEISDYVQNFLKEDKSNEDITSKYFIDKKQKFGQKPFPRQELFCGKISVNVFEFIEYKNHGESFNC